MTTTGYQLLIQDLTQTTVREWGNHFQLLRRPRAAGHCSMMQLFPPLNILIQKYNHSSGARIAP